MNTQRRRVSIITGALLTAVAAGCTATHQWIYEKPGMTPESLNRDRIACRAAAPPTGLTKLLDTDDVDRPAFTRCMEQRGYTARREVL